MKKKFLKLFVKNLLKLKNVLMIREEQKLQLSGMEAIEDEDLIPEENIVITLNT